MKASEAEFEKTKSQADDQQARVAEAKVAHARAQLSAIKARIAADDVKYQVAKGNVELVNSETLARMGRVSSATGTDVVLVMPTRFALGFMKTMDNRQEPAGVQDSVLFSEEAFGHVGAGGSFGFADPKAGMSFGYTMNKMGPGLSLNERGQSLVDAVYRGLGYQSDASGAWR